MVHRRCYNYMLPSFTVSLSLSPVPSSITFRDGSNQFHHFIGHLPRKKPPFPVFPHRRRRIHSAPVVQPEIVLHGDNADPRGTAHNHADEGKIQILSGCTHVTEIFSDKRSLLLCDAVIPSGNRLVVMGSRIGHAVSRIIVGEDSRRHIRNRGNQTRIPAPSCRDTRSPIQAGGRNL